MQILELISLLKQNFPTYTWTLPPDVNLGILTTNQAFLEAKERKGNPKLIADELAEELRDFFNSKTLPVKVITRGPYINLDFENNGWNQNLNKINELQLIQSQKKIILEYIGTNVAKKFHAGHMRNLNIGDSLRRVLKLKYPNLTTDNHWGDWGVTIGVLIWGWKQQGNLEAYNQDPVTELERVYVWANKQKDVVENWNELVSHEFYLLEQKDPGNYKLWKDFIEVTKEQCKKYLALMNVPYTDLEQGESFYEADMRILWDFMEAHNIWKKEGEARFFDFAELVENWTDLDEELKNKFKNFGRCYLISSKGYTSYAFRDVAARFQWTRDFDAETMITLTGNEQIHHFNQFFAILHYLSSLPEFRAQFGDLVADKIGWHNLIHIPYGFLTLENGRMSSRKGSVLTIQDLFEEVQDIASQNLREKSPNLDKDEVNSRSKKVALAALKWYDLNRGISEDLVLDIPQILKFEGNTGVYQLYTLARINSILEKNPLGSNPDFQIESLNQEEIGILKHLYTLPFVLENLCENYKPHMLCNYLYELASKINAWYPKYSVNAEEDQTRKETLLGLCLAVKKQFKIGLDLLGIESMEQL